MAEHDIADKARRLVALLDDPHPGLLTWCRARAEAAVDLHRALGLSLYGTVGIKHPLTRAEMNRLYPEETRAIQTLGLPNGAHHFELDTGNNVLSFESFGDGVRYEWRDGEWQKEALHG